MAFVDSGAALNLMDLEYARRCGFFLEPLQYPIPLRGIDATPLAKNKPQYWTQLTMCMAPAHQEDIRFLVLHNLHDVVVLGLPWLQVHNPVLDWKSMSVSSWGCQGVHGDVPFLSISSSTPSEVPEFLSDYRDVFDDPKASALPPHRDCDCAINLIPGSKFPKGRLFNLSVPEHAAMRSYIKESLEKGHIRPSSSPLGAGFFFVAKKDGSLRPCIDYRLLNKITVKFQYPLPLLSDLFARIKGASWFTKIDLRGAYNLVRIKQGDEWKTAFNTPEGHFEYLVMPFGLSNAPSVFQSFMHDIFREYLDKFLIVYLDDILVFSDDWESHVKQVRMVFQVLRANSLFVKGSKCLFGVQKVSFLGFIFSPSTIEMDPLKVQAIYDWTQPTSVKSLQKFLGFANFYRRFIANFSSVAKPLTDLTKKGADVVNWSSAAVEAFQELKRRFSSAPVLCQPDVSLPFQVEVDASEIGAGAVLSQRSSDGSVMKPCAFFSRKFSPAERNYDVGNRELLAMKWAFEEWRHWLEGAKHRVVVLTDHKNLTYLESAKRLNPRQARWSLFFSRFDFVVSYLPGSKNVKADALSRSFVPDSPGVPEPAGILKEGVESSDCPGVDTVVDRLQQIWTHVVDNLTLSQEKAQRFANRRRCVGPRLRVGDLVWLSSRYVPMKVSSPKFQPRFIGPYKISEVINPVSFRLALPASFAIHNVFHRSLLRRYVAPVVPSIDPPAPVLVEGELEYVVEKILDSRVSRRKLQYLVKWKGYGQEDNSWVFASDVHAADLLAIFIVVLLAGSSGTQRERLRTVELSRSFTFRNSGQSYQGIPIIAANMDTVGTFDMARELGKFSLFTAVHKHYSVEEWKEFAATSPEYIDNVAASAGTGQSDFQHLEEVLSAVPQIRYICLDVANGYSEQFVQHVKDVRARFPKHTIMAGNVVTGEMVEELILSGADIIKVGIGPGSVCTTRKKTGVGYPQLSAVIECADAAHGLNGHIISMLHEN
ncbi:unnamed protein product [Ranitomeya imitator]|uniref:Reverse transcriptase n=1 Tax=Ranitomeya imitator TaxID=111125 RepID=A0ABN9ME01_9NEOB|nr:unnamed protein product [Ranitomeya imitator]